MTTEEELKTLKSKIAELSIMFVETQKIIFKELIDKGIIDREKLRLHFHGRSGENTAVMAPLYETLGKELGF